MCWKDLQLLKLYRLSGYTQLNNHLCRGMMKAVDCPTDEWGTLTGDNKVGGIPKFKQTDIILSASLSAIGDKMNSRTIKWHSGSYTLTKELTWVWIQSKAGLVVRTWAVDPWPALVLWLYLCHVLQFIWNYSCLCASLLLGLKDSLKQSLGLIHFFICISTKILVLGPLGDKGFNEFLLSPLKRLCAPVKYLVPPNEATELEVFL